MLSLAFVIVVAYLVGSIPTSILLSRIKEGIDIREHGSGNAGGTNVIRVLGLKYGLIVIAVDMFKGYAATMFVPHLMYGPIPFTNRTPFEDFTVMQLICGSAAIVGHVWTVFGGFRGGKGIATAGGMLLGLAPTEVLVSLIVFSIVFVASRYVSLGSISAAIVFPLTMFFRENVLHDEVHGYGTLIFFSIGICLLLIFTHRANIKRLIEGTENRLTSLRAYIKQKRSSRN